MRRSIIGLGILLSAAAAPADDAPFPPGIVVEELTPGTASRAGLKPGLPASTA